VVAGTVKWFDPVKGIGFIRPEDGSKDVLVQAAGIRAARLSTLNQGQRVEYDPIKSNDGRIVAHNIRLI
jgi:cold shock protein